METNPYQSPAPQSADSDRGVRSFRLSRDFKYAAEYRPALFTAIKWQSLFFVLTLLMLDMGQAHKAYWIALFIHWVIIGFILTLAPQSPSRLGLAFIRYGILILAIFSTLLAPHLFPHRSPAKARPPFNRVNSSP
ncbi:MAG TPA: hypothetical protein VJ783_28385 [Pirellulales bacterium]|nr:hypothetical protein [Pirellulales bacterium]